MDMNARRQRAGALASNCTYTYVLSGSGPCSLTESTAKTWIPSNPDNANSRPACNIQTQNSIRSIKCQRVRSHLRGKKVSRTQLQATTSKSQRGHKDEHCQTDLLCISPVGVARKVKVSSTRKHAKTLRRKSFTGPLPIGVRLVNQIAVILVRFFVGQRHIETDARRSGG